MEELGYHGVEILVSRFLFSYKNTSAQNEGRWLVSIKWVAVVRLLLWIEGTALSTV